MILWRDDQFVKFKNREKSDGLKMDPRWPCIRVRCFMTLLVICYAVVQKTTLSGLSDQPLLVRNIVKVHNMFVYYTCASNEVTLVWFCTEDWAARLGFIPSVTIKGFFYTVAKSS